MKRAGGGAGRFVQCLFSSVRVTLGRQLLSPLVAAFCDFPGVGVLGTEGASLPRPQEPPAGRVSSAAGPVLSPPGGNCCLGPRVSALASKPCPGMRPRPRCPWRGRLTWPQAAPACPQGARALCPMPLGWGCPGEEAESREMGTQALTVPGGARFKRKSVQGASTFLVL